MSCSWMAATSLSVCMGARACGGLLGAGPLEGLFCPAAWVPAIKANPATVTITSEIILERMCIWNPLVRKRRPARSCTHNERGERLVNNVTKLRLPHALESSPASAESEFTEGMHENSPGGTRRSRSLSL